MPEVETLLKAPNARRPLGARDQACLELMYATGLRASEVVNLRLGHLNFEEGILRVIDADSDEVLHHWHGHEDWIYALALSPDGGLLASGDWTGGVKLWNVNGAQARPVGDF